MSEAPCISEIVVLSVSCPHGQSCSSSTLLLCHVTVRTLVPISLPIPPTLTPPARLQILSSPDAAPPLKTIASATSQISELPAAVKDSLSSLASTISSSTTLPATPQSLRDVVSGATDAWGALQAAFPSDASAPTLPSLPSLSPPTPPSPADLASLFNSSALLNGTFSEAEVIAIVSAAAAVLALATITAHTSAGSFPETASDAELPSEYDGDAIYRYWSHRPSTMLARSIETATLAAGFLVGLQLDRATGRVKENERMRARMLREAVDRLGPAYIKVAQALSTRVDLLSPAYYEEITLLQDQVKPFPCAEAMDILEVCCTLLPMLDMLR